MNFNRYQEKASRTLPEQEIDQTKNDILKNMCFGITGETGEFIDYMKKVFWHGHELDKNKVVDELGDILWYIAGICTTLNVDLISVPIHNIDKLRKRYPKGFEETRSINREEFKHLEETEEPSTEQLPLPFELSLSPPPEATSLTFMDKLLGRDKNEELP